MVLQQQPVYYTLQCQGIPCTGWHESQADTCTNRPSDYSCGGNEDLGAMQSMTMGLSRWLPTHGGAYLGVDPYAWRSVGIGTKNCA